MIEGRIPRTSKGFRAATLFANSTAHRMLADMARAQLAKAHPNLNFGAGPGISIPLDRLEIRREQNGDLYVVFISPLGELKSQSPIPSQALFEGAPLVASMGPLTIHGEAGATSTVEAAIEFRLDADEARLNVKEAIIRIRVKVPAFFVDQSDQTRVPALFAPLSPSK